MPTDKPKVSAYVPQVLKDKVLAFQEERGVSESQAVTIILAEYFGVTAEIERISHGAEVGGVTLSAFQELQSRVQELIEWKQRTKEKSETLSDSAGSLQEPSLSKPSQFELPSKPLEVKPLTGVCLAKRLNVSTSTVSTSKRKNRLAKLSLEKDPDGIVWKSMKHGYLPESKLSSEQQSSLLEWIKENAG